MSERLGLDAWWDEPAYRPSRETFSERGCFILAKLRAHDAAKLEDVLADVYRDAVPTPWKSPASSGRPSSASWGASPEEIKDVQLQMGRVWR